MNPRILYDLFTPLYFIRTCSCGNFFLSQGMMDHAFICTVYLDRFTIDRFPPDIYL